MENYEDHIDKYILCIKSDKTFGITKGNGYKIIKIEENNGEFYYNILTEKLNFENGDAFRTVAFRTDSNYFMNVEDSFYKLRELKLKRILNGKKNQTYYTNEE